MKANRWTWILVFLVLAATVFQLPAQQAEADRKLFDEVKAKAEKGDAEAQFILAGFYYNGDGVAKDAIESVKWIRKAADQQHAAAQCALGFHYERGDGVSRDLVEAVKWFGKAAYQGDAKAQFSLGACYRAGEGVAKNDEVAMEWLRKAAEQGFAPAQHNLGIRYANGDGVIKDDVEAVKWYRKAADQEVPRSQHVLAGCYAKGKGVAKDFIQAVKWYRKAAEQGYDEAQLSLGACYESGDGVPKDFIEAAKWYRKAANQGHASAQFLLGICCVQGKGVTIDFAESYKWFNLASAQGDEDSKTALAIVERKMTPEQIAEAQRLARDFKPRKTLGADASDSRPSTSGTGFFISSDGYLISNHHVVEGANQVRLVTSAGLISAKVVKVDAANDLALLKAEGRFASLAIASSRGVKLGGTVVTVGFPNIGLQGFAPKLAKGEIASLSGAGDDARYFQISVPVQPGNSGGALVDERGNVVGVVAAKLSASAALKTTGALPENVNYAVKSSYLLSFLESVPEVSAKLKEPNTREMKFEDVVKSAEQAAVLVLVY
ncbi:MAG: SEL1-like repeat protein [Verrucomicrobia bacterium]|nr:SEL1-like repeat protein [Verrucomicrobiota bacterium]